MLLITWNVNSVKTRKDRLLALLERHEPDVVCLQELKVTAENFPFDAIEEAGYHATVHAQASYNGVAILSKQAPARTRLGFCDDRFEDPHARLVTAWFEGGAFPKKGHTAIVCGYFPNGQTPDSDKFVYKLDFFDRVRRVLKFQHSAADRLVVTGDFNVAPHDDDAVNPKKWRESVLMHDRARTLFNRLLEWGLADAFTAQSDPPLTDADEGGDPRARFTWWDYRQRGWDNNDGLRIDHVLATEAMIEGLGSVRVDLEERDPDSHESAPSDHAPVLATFEF